MLAHREQEIRSIEVYNMIFRNNFVANSKWFEDVFGCHLEVVANSLPTEEVKTARIRAQSMGVWETVNTLLE